MLGEKFSFDQETDQLKSFGAECALRFQCNLNLLKQLIIALWAQYRLQRHAVPHNAALAELEAEREATAQEMEAKKAEKSALQSGEGGLGTQDLHLQTLEERYEQAKEKLGERGFTSLSERIGLGGWLLIACALCVFTSAVYITLMDSYLSGTTETNNLASWIYSQSLIRQDAIADALSFRKWWLLSVPFIVFALAHLLHKFYQEKRWWGAGFLLFAVLTMEVLLAYVSSLRMFRQRMMVDESIGNPTFLDLISDPNFFGIFMFGSLFIVVLGLVVARAESKLNEMMGDELEIQKLKRQVRDCRERRDEHEARIHDRIERLDEEIDSLAGRSRELDGEILRRQNLAHLIKPHWDEFEEKIALVFLGWLETVKSNFAGSDNERIQALQEASMVFDVTMQNLKNQGQFPLSERRLVA